MFLSYVMDADMIYINLRKVSTKLNPHPSCGMTVFEFFMWARLCSRVLNPRPESAAGSPEIRVEGDTLVWFANDHFHCKTDKFFGNIVKPWSFHQESSNETISIFYVTVWQNLACEGACLTCLWCHFLTLWWFEMLFTWKAPVGFVLASVGSYEYRKSPGSAVVTLKPVLRYSDTVYFGIAWGKARLALIVYICRHTSTHTHSHK